jgi:hypothetical protein
MIEAEFQDRMIDALRERNVYVRALVGTMLQSGLPDLLIISPTGLTFHCENKVWEDRRPPSCRDDFVKLLKGPQRNVITNGFWARRAYCPMVAFNKALITDAWFYDNLRDTVVYNKWIAFVDYFARLPNNAIHD